MNDLSAKKDNLESQIEAIKILPFFPYHQYWFYAVMKPQLQNPACVTTIQACKNRSQGYKCGQEVYLKTSFDDMNRAIQRKIKGVR